MVVLFVKNNKNTYPKRERTLKQMYRVVQITKRGNSQMLIYLWISCRAGSGLNICKPYCKRKQNELRSQLAIYGY